MGRWLIVAASALLACGDNIDVDDGGIAAPAVIEAPATVMLVEGDTASFIVKLARDPEQDVTIDIVSRNTAAAAVATASITLSSASFATGEAVTLLGIEDDGDVVNDAAEIELSVRGNVLARVLVTVFDNDVQQIVIDPAALTIAEGSSATFGVRLARRPADPVTVELRSTRTTVAVPEPAQLTFAADTYHLPQLVTVHAIADNDVADNTASISVGNVPTAAIEVIDVHVTDDDTQALVLTPSALRVAEGDTAWFTVALAFDPVTAVEVQVQSDTPSVVATPSVLFNSGNYNVPQTITLVASDDTNALDDLATIMLSGPASGSVTVQTTDNDVIRVGTFVVYVSEGRTQTFSVWLASDPGPSGRTVDVDVIAGPVQLLQDTLTFTSANYAVAQEVTVYAPLDATSSSNSSALLRVSSPEHGAVDVPVSIFDRTPRPLGVSVRHELARVEAIGWMELDLMLDTTWPGDGRVVIDLPAGYDASAASVLATSLDGSLSITATASRITLTRTGGTALYYPAQPRIRLANIRNPGVSGDHTIAVATQTSAGAVIDSGTGSARIAYGGLASASVSLATLEPGATGNVTFTFTTQTTWPSDGLFEISFPFNFDVTAVTAVAHGGFDGSLTASSLGPTRVLLARSGGTAVPAGSTVSVTIGNIKNPTTAQATIVFQVMTEGASGGWIEVGFPEGVVIGCPATMTKTAQQAYNAPLGGVPWLCPQCATSGGAYIPILQSSDWLVVHDFRFAMPAGATVVGIRFDVGHESHGWPVVDSAVRVVRGTIGTSDRSSAAQWALQDTVSYGGASDLWGESWTAADIESSSFGVALAARAVTTGMTGEVHAGPVSATVYLSCP